MTGFLAKPNLDQMVFGHLQLEQFVLIVITPEHKGIQQHRVGLLTLFTPECKGTVFISLSTELAFSGMKFPCSRGGNQTMTVRDTPVSYWHQGLLCPPCVPSRAFQKGHATRDIHAMSSKHFISSDFESLSCVQSIVWIWKTKLSLKTVEKFSFLFKKYHLNRKETLRNMWRSPTTLLNV